MLAFSKDLCIPMIWVSASFGVVVESLSVWTITQISSNTSSTLECRGTSFVCSSGSFFGVTSSTEGCRTMASSPALGRPSMCFRALRFRDGGPVHFREQLWGSRRKRVRRTCASCGWWYGG